MPKSAMKRGKSAQPATEPRLGIFWLLKDTLLLIESAPLGECERYGDHLNYPESHIRVWERWQQTGKAPMESEYEEYPRGRVCGPIRFLLVAVWACPVGQIKELNYIGQVFEAIKRHRHWFGEDLPTVFCGDFNSNAIFRSRKIRHHNAVVGLLEERNIVSAYHAYFREKQGEETRPTHYFRFQKADPFHIDYVFLPRGWIPSLKKVTVGTYREWRPASDHVPMVVDLSLPA